MNTNLICKVTLYLRPMIAQSLASKEWTHSLLPLTNLLLNNSMMRLLAKKKFNWALKINKINSMTQFIQSSNSKPTSKANLCSKTTMLQESLQQALHSPRLLINNLCQFPLKLMSITMKMTTVCYLRARKRRSKNWLRSRILSERWQIQQMWLTKKRKNSLLKNSFRVMVHSLHGKRKIWGHLLPLALENII